MLHLWICQIGQIRPDNTSIEEPEPPQNLSDSNSRIKIYKAISFSLFKGFQESRPQPCCEFKVCGKAYATDGPNSSTSLVHDRNG